MSDQHHDDFGGLHRDLLATGAAINRRGVLRLGRAIWRGDRRAATGGLQRLAHVADRRRRPPPTRRRPRRRRPRRRRQRATCSRIPQETEGPYPADGSNGPTVLSSTGVVRSDIRSSFAGMSGIAAGVPLNVVLTIVSASTCAPLAGAAVYLWHCDREGRYSLYTQGVTNQNYLRGVQEADANGRVTFQSIYPGLLRGPVAAHSLRGLSDPLAATSVATRRRPRRSRCRRLPAISSMRDGYEQSIRNAAQITLASTSLQRRLGARTGDDHRRRHQWVYRDPDGRHLGTR